MQVLFLYLITVNVLAFVLFGLDKYKARKGFWRISERGLMFAALLGGSVGALCGMRLFRHKTKHSYFYFVNVLGLAWQVTLLYFLALGNT